MRVTLTKAEQQGAAGVELLQLCQTVTEDGRLSDEEIKELRSWLEENRRSDLPSIDFLTTTIEQILDDGQVTKDERRELQKALERVLPREARSEAAQQRQKVQAEDRACEVAQEVAEKHRKREDRERRRPVCWADFMVAGVFYEGRPHVISRHVHDDDTVYLIRDRQNKYSRNAIEVRLGNGMQIGFVPEDYAVDLASYLDQGCPHAAYVKKTLRGHRGPIPVVVARVYRQGADVEGLVYEREVPKKSHFSAGNAEGRGQGCLGSLMLGLLPIFGLIGLVLARIR